MYNLVLHKLGQSRVSVLQQRPHQWGKRQVKSRGRLLTVARKQVQEMSLHWFGATLAGSSKLRNSRMGRSTDLKKSSRSRSRELKVLERSSSAAPEGVGEERPPYCKRDGPATGEDRDPKPCPEGPGRGEQPQPEDERSPQSDHHSCQDAHRGRRHQTSLYACIQRRRRRGGRRTSRTGRASRGRRPTLATLLTRPEPLPARRAPAALLRAGGLPSTLMLTGRSSRRGSTSGRTHTWSGNTRKHAEGVADGSGAAEPGNTKAPEMPAAKNAKPTTASH